MRRIAKECAQSDVSASRVCIEALLTGVCGNFTEADEKRKAG